MVNIVNIKANTMSHPYIMKKHYNIMVNISLNINLLLYKCV